MSTRILVVGGYGNFGSFIVRRLTKEPDIDIIVAGRSEGKARQFAESVQAEWIVADIEKDIEHALTATKPNIVIHTSGPFQEQSYEVAGACIKHQMHYIDLADGRDFVGKIDSLDSAAKAAGVLVVSGASSVPGLTSAIIDKYRNEFTSIDTLNYGITTAQKTNRGLATTSAVLGYVGKPFETLFEGNAKKVYGWQSLTWRKFTGLGWRVLGNCDVPDLDLFPQRYPDVKSIRFQAGIELSFMHLILWMLSWLVRFRILPNLKVAARFMLALSRPFDLIGSDSSGFFMDLAGQDSEGNPKSLTFEIIARAGDGVLIPCTPAIVIALKLARGELSRAGAQPCLGLFDLDELLDELSQLDIKWAINRHSD